MAFIDFDCVFVYLFIYLFLFASLLYWSLLPKSCYKHSAIAQLLFPLIFVLEVLLFALYYEIRMYAHIYIYLYKTYDNMALVLLISFLKQSSIISRCLPCSFTTCEIQHNKEIENENHRVHELLINKGWINDQTIESMHFVKIQKVNWIGRLQRINYVQRELTSASIKEKWKFKACFTITLLLHAF